MRKGNLASRLFHDMELMTRNVLLITDGIFHPPLLGRLVLQRSLKELEGFAFEHIRSLEQLPDDVEKYSALVLHYHHKRISPAALVRLGDFVKRGGGILAIHAATASFKETLPYFDILGGRFSGHGKVEQFEVVNQSSDIFIGIPNFCVKDELYLHELNDRIRIHFTASYAGKDVPVVWTYQYGKGKVCYAVPGHTTATMRNQDYLQVLQHGLQWVMR
jgi:uncharacterized protein